MKKFFKFIKNIPNYIAKGFVNFYKVCISPLLPHCCKFKPTCSTYMLDCLKRFGFFKGLWLGTKRIFKCNPWAIGGLDPAPYNLKGDFKWVI